MPMRPLIFRYSADVLARYPTTVGGILVARGLRNGPTPAALLRAYEAEQRATLARVGATPLSEIESLAAWRSAFRGFGVDPTQIRSAPEALLRRLTKKGDIPSINLLVDLGNLVSIRHALPVAIFDARAVGGGLTVRFADGSERFTELGAAEAEHPQPGEVIFADETGLVAARRWCWRQSVQSAARPDTTAAIIAVEAQHAGGRAASEAAQRDLLALLHEYAGGDYVAALLDAGNPELSG
ncbi:MAG TPA: phenylalanine--tRNA ligase beta subunit-related protein [Ktedonobacterales bacterium]|nr:phenylalanine--tRNA ligase beta subunit-related protein [Ktedonobacterales bacterium]